MRLAIVLGVLVGLGLSCQARRVEPPRPVVRPPAPTPVRASTPVPRVTPPPAPEPTPGLRATEAPAGRPRIAIVFDDAGGSLEDVEEIIAIGRPVTVAVLPGLAHSSEVARRAAAAGLEVILHLPIEATGHQPLGPHGVRVSMSDAEIAATVRAALHTVPGAVGVNNHMGSLGTADRRVMRAVLAVARQKGLYFVDSRTTADTVAADVAAELGVPRASRTIFLDNANEEEAIRAEVQRLISLARTRGEAIAIGHAQHLAPRIVAQMRDEFDRQGVELVPLSMLVR
ncbi:MAG: divergent polysaccharide deacetylase family protein [Armatimonadota bacterium]|nr:divergent polysaccharide deacetylase family protein [Armatimonadota bacterium]